MSPETNVALLAQSAQALGELHLTSEWDLVLAAVKFGDFNVESEGEFMEEIKNYTYYNALVCKCQGDMEQVKDQLQADYLEIEEPPSPPWL